jgi:hypothetical protein
MARDQDVRTSRLYDRRTVERNIKKGLITRKDYEKHLKSLEDVAGKGAYGEADPIVEDEDEADEAEPAAAAEAPGGPSGTNNQGH